MKEIYNMSKDIVNLRECDHIDVNIENNTNLDVNIRKCEHLTLRIEDARSNFRVELNGVGYSLNDSGTKLVSKTL